MLDLLITSGSYPDFEKDQMREGNIGIKDGKIVFVGTGRPESLRTVDASGKVVSPGFIDIHMHEEDFLKEGERYVIAEMMLKMGVTTAVGGNCGIQRQSVKHFREAVKRMSGAPINYLIAAGYNQCRTKLGIGRHRAAEPDQRRTIRRMLEAELEEGACGISFGIEYDPGISAGEIMEALSVLEGSKLLASAHYRSSCIKDICSIEEMIEIAEKVPVKFQISHLSSCSAMGRMDQSLEAIKKAMEKNDRLSFDTYPYNAFSTLVGSEVFEPGCLDRWKKGYDCIMLTSEPYRNVRCTEEILKDARENYPEMLAVVFAMNEEEIASAIGFREGMIASDGIISGGKGHPRAAGTFPRVLGKYVREDKVISLQDALRKMTLEPAKRLELSGKGRIALGCDADITIFDPQRVADRATFTDLDLQPEGIDYVIIAGCIALEHKKVTDDRLGKFIGR